MSRFIEDVPGERARKREWSLFVNHVKIADVRRLLLQHPRHGELDYGLVDDDCDGWCFREARGGTATLPFCFIGEALFVGLVRKALPTMAGPTVLDVPRGFIAAGEPTDKAAYRELREELGAAIAGARLFALDGEPGNPHSAFFDTSKKGDGTRFFAVEVPRAALERQAKVYVFKRTFKVSEDTQGGRLRDGIVGCEFVEWSKAAQLSDLHTCAAVARLLAHLNSRKKVFVERVAASDDEATEIG